MSLGWAVKNGTKEKVRQLLDDPDVDSEWKSKALAEAAKIEKLS